MRRNDGKLAGFADDDAIFDVVYKYPAELIHGKGSAGICESHEGVVPFIAKFYTLTMPYSSSIWLRATVHRAAS